jgi:hypothetical protein
MNRHWPTVKLFRKVGDQNPEELAVVGKVDEFPNDFVLSPDKKSILINLESKLQLLNLETKKLEDLTSLEKRNHAGAIFSPDGSRIFVWDENYASKNREYFVHMFNLSTRSDQVIKQGFLPEAGPRYLIPECWQKDNKIVMSEPLMQIWYYDLETNEYKKTPQDIFNGPFTAFSSSCKLVSSPGSYVDDPCDQYDGAAESSYPIFDPISGQEIDRVGSGQDVVTILGFSPDDQEIIYATFEPITDIDDETENYWQACYEKEQQQEKTIRYYRKNIGADNQGIPIDNHREILYSWGKLEVNARVSFSDDKYQLILDNQIVLSSNNHLMIVAKYYR